MATQLVKWPGANIHEDITHRLVTDEQIERWDRIRELDDDEFWIELTPENIGEYTCTKEDPDGYWTDMGMAEGTIFDSSSLDPGNYIIKLGMDKLCKMNSVSLPHFRTTYGDNPPQYTDMDHSNAKEYVMCLDYGIDPTTMIFLCQFFGVEFSLDDLINKLNTAICFDSNITLSIGKNTGVKEASLTTSEDGSTDIKLLFNDIRQDIIWLDCIKIQIKERKYGSIDNQKTALERYITAVTNIVDYYDCGNYTVDMETLSAMFTTDEELYDYVTRDDVELPAKVLDEPFGIPVFTKHYTDGYYEWSFDLGEKISRSYSTNNDNYYGEIKNIDTHKIFFSYNEDGIDSTIVCPERTLVGHTDYDFSANVQQDYLYDWYSLSKPQHTTEIEPSTIYISSWNKICNYANNFYPNGAGATLNGSGYFRRYLNISLDGTYESSSLIHLQVDGHYDPEATIQPEAPHLDIKQAIYEDRTQFVDPLSDDNQGSMLVIYGNRVVSKVPLYYGLNIETSDSNYYFTGHEEHRLYLYDIIPNEMNRSITDWNEATEGKNYYMQSGGTAEHCPEDNMDEIYGTVTVGKFNGNRYRRYTQKITAGSAQSDTQYCEYMRVGLSTDSGDTINWSAWNKITYQGNWGIDA